MSSGSIGGHSRLVVAKQLVQSKSYMAGFDNVISVQNVEASIVSK